MPAEREDLRPITAREVVWLLDRLILRNRLTMILLSASMALFWKVLEHKPTTVVYRGDPIGNLDVPMQEGGPAGGQCPSKSPPRGRAGRPTMRRNRGPDQASLTPMTSEDPMALMEQLLKSSNDGAWLGRAQLVLGQLRRSRHLEEATPLLRAAVQRLASVDGELAAVGLMALGSTQLQAGSYSAAAADFEQAVLVGGRSPALAAAGWAQLLSGNRSSAEGHLTAVLGKQRSSGSAPLSEVCQPRGNDDVDSAKVVALAGLGVLRNEPEENISGEAWLECANYLLTWAGPGVGYGGETPSPFLALGLAHLALGQVQAAQLQLSKLGEAEGDPAFLQNLSSAAPNGTSAGEEALPQLQHFAQEHASRLEAARATEAAAAP